MCLSLKQLDRGYHRARNVVAITLSLFGNLSSNFLDVLAATSRSSKWGAQNAPENPRIQIHGFFWVGIENHDYLLLVLASLTKRLPTP
jgi:hypothetical protein